MFPRIRAAIDSLLLDDSLNLSGDHDYDSCVQLIQQYFCYYYWPVCDEDSGDIFPVCQSSCNLLINNGVCSQLLTTAVNMMREQGFPDIPSDESCERTVLYDTTLADTCIFIEGEI